MKQQPVSCGVAIKFTGSFQLGFDEAFREDFLKVYSEWGCGLFQQTQWEKKNEEWMM